MPFDPSRVRAVRKKRGLTQRQVADRMGINIRRLQEYEGKAGKRQAKPGADHLELLASALQTNMDYLMQKSNYDGVLTELHQRLAEAFDRGDTQTILDIIRQKALEEGRNKGRLPGMNPGSKTKSLKRR